MPPPTPSSTAVASAPPTPRLPEGQATAPKRSDPDVQVISGPVSISKPSGPVDIFVKVDDDGKPAPESLRSTHLPPSSTTMGRAARLISEDPRARVDSAFRAIVNGTLSPLDTHGLMASFFPDVGPVARLDEKKVNANIGLISDTVSLWWVQARTELIRRGTFDFAQIRRVISFLAEVNGIFRQSISSIGTLHELILSEYRTFTGIADDRYGYDGWSDGSTNAPPTRREEMFPEEAENLAAREWAEAALASPSFDGAIDDGLSGIDGKLLVRRSFALLDSPSRMDALSGDQIQPKDIQKYLRVGLRVIQVAEAMDDASDLRSAAWDSFMAVLKVVVSDKVDFSIGDDVSVGVALAVYPEVFDAYANNWEVTIPSPTRVKGNPVEVLHIVMGYLICERYPDQNLSEKPELLAHLQARVVEEMLDVPEYVTPEVFSILVDSAIDTVMEAPAVQVMRSSGNVPEFSGLARIPSVRAARFASHIKTYKPALLGGSGLFLE